MARLFQITASLVKATSISLAASPVVFSNTSTQISTTPSPPNSVSNGFDAHSSGHVSALPAVVPLPTELKEECMIWDSSCTGNRTMALQLFFDKTASELHDNRCFLYENTSLCDPLALSQVPVIKSWMRSPQCSSVADEYDEPVDVVDLDNPCDDCAIGGIQHACCSNSILGIGNVDVYYWPEVGADTACLSIIGNVAFPIDHGATTESDINGWPISTYWGCTTQISTGLSTGLSTITTAIILKAGHAMPYKSYLIRRSLVQKRSSNPEAQLK
jgi:hypothetical protein